MEAFTKFEVWHIDLHKFRYVHRDTEKIKDTGLDNWSITEKEKCEFYSI